MQDDQVQKDTSPAQPTESPVPVPPSETTATEENIQNTEAREEFAQEGGAEDDAPDADEPGDDVAPEELQQYEQEMHRIPDNVDQEG